MAVNLDQIKNTPQVLMYKSGETKPTNLAEGSICYVYEGVDKGKIYIFDGTNWVEQ